jgi:replicative DNA helicase
MQQGYDLSRLTSYIDGIMDEAEAHTSDHELKLGYPIFDKCFGGIPHTDAFISIPGKPNQGKSSFLCNIAHRLVDNNDNVIVLYHTVDDAMRWFLPRLLGSRYRVASDYFYKAGYYLATNPLVAVNGGDKQQFRDVYADAKKWFRTKLAAERLLPFDASMLDQNVFSLEMRVRDLRKKYPTTPIVVFGDNFHLYTNPAVKEDGEAKTRGLSMACKNLANVHHVTVIMTMELPKSALEEGKRPRMMNIKGSAGISYDASANIGVYNDQKDLRERAELTWDEDVEPTEIAPGQMVTRIKRPILEMVFDKSKVNGGFDGNIYYAFHPTSGQVVECDALDQEKYRAKAARQQEQRKNPAPKGAKFTSGYLPSVEPAPMLAMTEEEAVRPFM